MQKYQDTVLNGPTGRPVAGATVTVTTLAGAPATIYSDNGVTPISTLTTRTDGSFAFYAEDGRYTIAISGAGLTTKTITDILLFDGTLESVNLFDQLPGSVRSAIRNGVLAAYADVTAAILDAHADNPGRGIILPDGAYRVSGTVDLTADNSFLQGAGQSTRIFQYTPDIDTFRLRPTTAGTTSAFLNSPALRNLFVSHTPVAASSTQGAAVRVTQCNAWRVTGVYTADADIFVEGGQAGFIDDIWGYAVNGSYRGTDSALLHFLQAAYGASYQSMFTTQVGRINLSGSGKRDTVIRVANCDGLSFGKGYANNSGGNSIFKIKAERDNSYVAALNLGSLYLDGVGGCLNGIDAPADGYANSFIYHLVLPRTVNIGGFAERGIKVRKDIQSFNNDAEIINCTLWGVDFEGDSTNSVLKFSPTTSTNGDATTGDIRIGGSGRSISIAGWKTKGAENVALLLAAGTWGRGVIAHCVNDTDIADISNLATFTGALDFNGNVSAYTGAVGNSWRGLNQVTGKTTPVDADVLSLWDSAASWFRKSLTIANLAAALLNGRAIGATSQSTGKFTTVTATGLVDISGAAAGQISFPATQNASAGVNVLDDYEEGTFTPTLTFGGAATGMTLSTQTGNYTKIGNRVFYDGIITLSAKGSSTGAAVIGALPFQVAVNTPGALRMTNATSGVGDTFLSALALTGSTTMRIDKITTGFVTQLTDADFTATSVIQFSGNYRV